jgi:hypothetical protein
MRALFVGLGLDLCSVATFYVLPSDLAPYALMPALFVGIFVAAIAAAAVLGNAHGMSEGFAVVIASVVNLPCYVGLAYAVLSQWFKNSEGVKSENRSEGGGDDPRA